MNQQNCFCNSLLSFSNCCGRFISHLNKPETPEQLMRSRYTAFNLGDINYLIKTLYPSKRQEDDAQIIQQTINETKWLGLKIIDSINNTNSGFVEFVAFFQDDLDGYAQLHERSNFIKVDDYWFYLDGEQLPPIKLGRNETCFCSSSKKFKKCHGA